MHLRFFHHPIHGGDEAATELNRFSARTASWPSTVRSRDGANSAWALCVSF
ncbi:MAG: hypothetical protein R3F40_07170 [Candidatus Competibacteraceae bacterium]